MIDTLRQAAILAVIVGLANLGYLMLWKKAALRAAWPSALVTALIALVIGFVLYALI